MRFDYGELSNGQLRPALEHFEEKGFLIVDGVDEAALWVGPFVEVSTNFHAQFKRGVVRAVDHGGYSPKAQYLEVQGQYLLDRLLTRLDQIGFGSA